MRDQLLAANVQRLDAVLMTHDHADQSHGLDDLRALLSVLRNLDGVFDAYRMTPGG